MPAAPLDALRPLGSEGVDVTGPTAAAGTSGLRRGARWPTRPVARYAAAFRHRDYRLLVLAFSIDAVGRWAAHVVVDVVVFQATGSLTWLAIAACASWVPGLLVAPLGGVLADRLDRRAVLIVSALAAAAVAAAATAVVGTGGPVVLLVLLNVAGAVVRSPYRPAAGALTPRIVTPAALPAANACFAALENLVIVVGPAIGGVLLLLGRPALGLALSAVAGLVAAGLAAGMRVRSRGDVRGGGNPVVHVAEGLRALRATPTAAVLLLFCGVDTLLAGAYTVVYIPISRSTGMGDEGYGALLAGAAVGGILGAALADRLSGAKRLAPVVVGGIALQAIPYALTPLTDRPLAGIGLQVLSGTGMVLVDVLALIAIQREVPSGRLSRALSMFDTTQLLASVVGSVVASALLTAVPYGPSLVILGTGCTAIALGLAPLLVQSDRRAEAVRRTAEEGSRATGPVRRSPDDVVHRARARRRAGRGSRVPRDVRSAAPARGALERAGGRVPQHLADDRDGPADPHGGPPVHPAPG